METVLLPVRVEARCRSRGKRLWKALTPTGDTKNDWALARDWKRVAQVKLPRTLSRAPNDMTPQALEQLPILVVAVLATAVVVRVSSPDAAPASDAIKRCFTPHVVHGLVRWNRRRRIQTSFQATRLFFRCSHRRQASAMAAEVHP
ncbi:MAG: hypothetical protein J0I96_12800 [Rhodanobacter sp.]|nr:hypothetical protein [Rhodanobacter sp.]